MKWLTKLLNWLRRLLSRRVNETALFISIPGELLYRKELESSIEVKDGESIIFDWTITFE